MSSSKPIPSFFILGAPKCGTTALQVYLSGHPNVFIPNGERNYFSKDLQISKHKDLHDYMNAFRGVPESDTIIGEKSTWYLYSEEAVRNILQFNPEAKFIVLVRNPVDMAHSLHAQFFKSKSQKKNIKDFRRAWLAQEERNNGKKLPVGCPEPKLLQYGAVCMLGRQLEKLYTQVSKERVLVINYDDLKNDAKGVYESALDFLGLARDQRAEFPVINKNKTVTFNRLRRFAYLLGKIKNDLGIHTRFGILTKIIAGTIKEKEREPLSDEFRKELFNYFKKDIEKLSKLTGRDLSHWS